MNQLVKKTFAIIFVAFSFTQLNGQTPKKLELLFLGHNSKHHNSDVLASIMSKEYFKKGIITINECLYMVFLCLLLH